jgi:hypothetical protein
VNPGAGDPVHVPGFAVNCCPTVVVPDTDGKTVFTGGAAIGPTACEVADDDPAVFVPVTVTATVSPASACASV